MCQYLETPYLQYRESNNGAIGGCYDNTSPNVDVHYGRNMHRNDGEAAFRLRRGNKVINLELNDEESLILNETLESFLSDLSYEISNTDLKKFREQLKARRVVLEKIKNALEQA